MSIYPLFVDFCLPSFCPLLSLCVQESEEKLREGSPVHFDSAQAAGVQKKHKAKQVAIQEFQTADAFFAIMARSKADSFAIQVHDRRTQRGGASLSSAGSAGFKFSRAHSLLSLLSLPPA